MAAAVPSKLKQLDLGRFAQRAVQIERVKPAIAYWCNYWILHQILANRLQQADEECTTYTMKLMDHVEQMKTQHASDDAIVDDVAGQAYVEQFGLETFQRADNAIQMNKASKQTADTLLASATFLELLNIWASPSPEVSSKIKYAKFHALRIVKAVKAGEDPNLSNPPPPDPDPAGTAADIALDPNDPEVQRITLAAEQPPGVPDSTADDGTAPNVGSAPPDVDPADSARTEQPPEGPETGRTVLPSSSEDPAQNPVAGEYFPKPPTPAEPTTLPIYPPPPRSPSKDSHLDSPEAFYSENSAPAAQPSTAPVKPTAPPTLSQAAPAVHAPSASAMLPSTAQPGAAIDDTAVADAQKHARWAISALNFDDVPTAVKELRLALSRLGAS